MRRSCSIKGSVRALTLILGFVLVFAGCGSGGGSSGSGESSSNSTNDGSLSIEISSGDSQIGLIGVELAEPLVVRLTKSNGKPLSYANVYFSLTAGDAHLTTPQITTDADGFAAVKMLPGAGLGDVLVRAEALNAGAVTFTITPRLPLLDEVAGAVIEDGLVAELPTVVAALPDGTAVLAIITGNASWLDLNNLPAAGDLSGALVDGALADGMPVVFVSAEQLVDMWNVIEPSAGDLSGTMVAGELAENLPTVLGFSVNGRQTVLAISGDASGISGLEPLGDLLSRNPLVDVKGGAVNASDIPARILNAADFPAVPDLDNSIYISLFDGLVPVFAASASVSGASGFTEMPVLTEPLSIFDLDLLDLSGGDVPYGLLINSATPLMDVCLPIGSLEQIPDKYLPIVEIIVNELMPLGEQTLPGYIAEAELLKQLVEVIEANLDLIAALTQGSMDNLELDDMLGLLSLAGEVIPIIDQMLDTQLQLLGIHEQQLEVIKNRLLPEIVLLLPADGIPFGGYSDGNASSVVGDIMPLVDDQLGLLLGAFPLITELVSDIEILLPDNGDIFALLGNIQNGGIDLILDDIEAIKDVIVDGLLMFNDRGIPILYDILEEVENRIPPGTLFVKDFDCYTVGVEWLQTVLPPDSTLGDLPKFDEWGPIVAGYLPPEWGEASEVGIFTTIVPAISDIDIGGDILPVIRSGLDAFAAAFPGIIVAINNFTFPEFVLPELPF